MISGSIWARLAAQPVALDSLTAATPLVVRLYYEDIRDLEQLQSVDVWEYNNLEDRYVLAALDLTRYMTLIDEGWRVVIDPVASQQMSPAKAHTGDFLGGYRTVDQLYEDLETLNSKAPELTELVDYGPSHCLSVGGCITPGGDVLAGYPLRAMRITNERIPGSSTIANGIIGRGTKPVFFLMANIHSREISTPEIAMRFLDYLMDGYGADADATWLVDFHEIWVVPTANPDGHWLVELGLNAGYGGAPFFQRKNANNDVQPDSAPDCAVWPPATFEQFGIDLNRNHGFGWGGLGASALPCDMTYRGPSAVSEIEVASLEALVRDLIPDQREAPLEMPAPDDTTGLFITLHSFSNLVLWPWGNNEGPAPNKDDLKAIGDKFASYNGYVSCQPSTCLYLTSGSSDDWAYGELGIPAFTFEIGNQFMPPYSEIDSEQWPDNRPALVYAAKIVGTPYRTVRGPDVLDLHVSNENSMLLVSATLDDRSNGENPIAAAAFSIDVPPWESDVELTPLLPADGSWNSNREAVSGQINPVGLATGRHTLFMQGQDALGNWGAVTAEFFDIETAVTFDKSAFSNFVAPGGILHYEIILAVSETGGNHIYTLDLNDVLPDEATVIPASIIVNGEPRPEIYDATARKIRYEAQGTFTDELHLKINYSVAISESVTTGQLITNQASAAVRINDQIVTIPAITTNTLVLTTIDQIVFPVILK